MATRRARSALKLPPSKYASARAMAASRLIACPCAISASWILSRRRKERIWRPAAGWQIHGRLAQLQSLRRAARPDARGAAAVAGGRRERILEPTATGGALDTRPHVGPGTASIAVCLTGEAALLRPGRWSVGVVASRPIDVGLETVESRLRSGGARKHRPHDNDDR